MTITGLKERMEKDGIIPDVVDNAPDSDVPLKVSFGDQEVQCGNELTLEQTQELPTIHLAELGAQDALYTVMLVDPDAPRYPVMDVRLMPDYFS